MKKWFTWCVYTIYISVVLAGYLGFMGFALDALSKPYPWYVLLGVVFSILLAMLITMYCVGTYVNFIKEKVKTKINKK